MRLDRLTIYDFRNFKRVEVQLQPRINFFLGENGQGKTNFIEAVHLLSRGVSFRPVDSQNFLRLQGLEQAKITGILNSGQLEYSVSLLLEPGRRSATVNGKRANSATLMSLFPIVLFSPESLSAIKEGPDQRRQLIDEILISHDPRQGHLLREHQRALKARNRLLKNISEKLDSTPDHLDSLESLNKIYFLLSTHLASARIKALKDIEPFFRDAMAFIMGDTHEDIAVDYSISGESALKWSDSLIFEALQKRHRSLVNQELAYGSSLVGPHKHDIRILFAGNDSRFYCSQGQQRALILAMKIAQIVYHHQAHQTYPVLLLDDVLSELDFKKRVSLMKFLEGISAQILITSTDLAWSDQIGFDHNSIFTVKAGEITRVDESFGKMPESGDQILG